MTILLLNYTHPLTPAQREQGAALLGEVPELRELATHVDRACPLVEVARELADAAGLTPEGWQTTPLVLNPPPLAPLALALIAELHGRCGGFAALLNLRPVAGSTPTRYEVAEIVNLQVLRETARRRR
ncbi:MAG: CRISPR-associated protein Csx15 [Chloroflexi bacterium OHK40]